MESGVLSSEEIRSKYAKKKLKTNPLHCLDIRDTYTFFGSLQTNMTPDSRSQVCDSRPVIVIISPRVSSLHQSSCQFPTSASCQFPTSVLVSVPYISPRVSSLHQSSCQFPTSVLVSVPYISPHKYRTVPNYSHDE
ncbi:hypothetical protein J6590_014822 [Homalodisca vitripennis]|nr:hypothetical protein J6590_014822 [Homalodisca vitripennis]